MRVGGFCCHDCMYIGRLRYRKNEPCLSQTTCSTVWLCIVHVLHVPRYIWLLSLVYQIFSFMLGNFDSFVGPFIVL
uniref:Uncharacterized protein n=1 Tax=Arundo donax TaxID=35708 RepID=A0A0A9EZF9_ARUDO